MALSPELLDRFKQCAGHGGWTLDPDRIAPHLREWRDRYHGATPIMLMPDNRDAVASIIRLAAETRTPIVPQGGNTGLVGGQIPHPNGEELLIWMGRMNKVRSIDTNNNTLTVDAGAILTQVQESAAAQDRFFPLSLASEGSAQIGGLISTNAGGTAVLAYGTMRDLVLGLEAVLPDGSIINALSGLRKDNTGYDIVRLLTGAEGTLGIITAATLKLFPQPRATFVAIAGVASPASAISLLTLMKADAGAMLTGFELMPRLGLEFVLRHIASARDPLSHIHPWYVLIELSLSGGASDRLLEIALARAIEEGLAGDAVIAQSAQQARDFWRLREALSEAQKFEGGSIKHDVSVPISAMPRFIDEATQAVLQAVPGARPIPFGHVGDGNVHFNVSQPVNTDRGSFVARWDEINDIVHGIASELGGSISAEHGIGQMKATEIIGYKDPGTLAAMRAIKRALDPQGIMNPGKVFPRDELRGR